MPQSSPSRPVSGHEKRGDELPVRVLLVDDHPVARLGLSVLLAEADGLEVCGDTGNPSEVPDLVAGTRPDVVIMDLSTQQGSELDLIHRIHRVRPSARILIFSMDPDPLFAERALRAGASGYVDKRESTPLILQAVREVIAGSVFVSPQATQSIVRRVAHNGSDTNPEPTALLTNRELEVFELLGRGLTSQEVAERLRLSVKTIDAHRQKLKSKLGLRSGNDLVYQAVRWVLRARS